MYIDSLNIKTVSGIVKYIKTQVDINIDGVKTDTFVKLFWMSKDKLHTYKIRASVIYVIKLPEIEEAIKAIKLTLN